MADIINDGTFKVWSVPSIANIAAPTTAELNAGTRLTDKLTKDGLKGFMPDTAQVDTTSLASTYNTSLPGKADVPPGSLTFKRQDSADTTWTTFIKGYTTNIVIRRDGQLETAAWASTNKVEVWPVKCGFRKDPDFAENEVQKYEVPVFFYSEPNQNATVA